LKKVGKDDQFRREISEAYPGKPVEQPTITVSPTAEFIQKSHEKSSNVTRLTGGTWRDGRGTR
jgi:hypothetical protein